ncbi:aminotransferase [Pseudomonadaceae bacterium SI-3]|nr:aminotransferase [Pseudomonadaceae bacterium SI-3]
MTTLELIASALGVLAVWLTVRQNPLCWPIGLVMVSLYAWFFFEVRLYSQVLLNGVFAAMQVYGWWQWTRGSGSEGGRPVAGATATEVGVGLVVAVLGSVGLGVLMATATEAAYPWPDATLTAFSLLAQLWMALKRWQCWVLWIVVDTLYVAFFAFQEYWLTAGLYGLFTLLAVMGLREWRQARAAVHEHAAPADS